MSKVDGRKKAATSLEDLGSGQRRAAELIVVNDDELAGGERPAKATKAMTTGFGLAGIFFAYGIVLKLLVATWIGIGAFVSAGAGLTLFHSGSLEPDLYAHSVVVAAIVNVVLLLGLGLAWLVRHYPPDEPIQLNLYGRHPLAVTAIGLLAAFGASVALFGSSTSSAADRITTIVVLTNAFYFTMLGIAGSMRIVTAMALAFERWTLASAYRAGVLTVLLIFGGLGGVALQKSSWYQASLAELRQDVDLKALAAADGVVDTLATAMCIAANEALEGGVSGTSAPECARLLAGGSGASQGRPAGSLGSGATGQSGGGSADDCFEELAPHILKKQQQLEKIGFSYEAQDAVMHAIVVTCTEEQPIESRYKYFSTVARNYALKRKQRELRNLSCDSLSQDEEQYRGKCVAPNDPPEERERKLAVLWESALCGVDELTTEVIKDRLIGNLRYRDIGQRRGLTEAEAKNRFNNAIKKFRSRADLCFLAADLRP